MDIIQYRNQTEHDVSWCVLHDVFYFLFWDLGFGVKYLV